MSKLPLPPRAWPMFAAKGDPPPKRAGTAESRDVRARPAGAAGNNAMKSAFVGARFPLDLLARIDAYAEERGIGRSKAMRELLEKGLS